MSKIYETEVAGRPLSLEFGKVAGLANGSVIVRYGDTVLFHVLLRQTSRGMVLISSLSALIMKKKCMLSEKFREDLTDVKESRQTTLY